MQVLVTGVTGFAGGRLSGHLVESGHAVRGLVRPASRGKLADLERTVEAVDGDLDDPASLARACAGVEVVYHVAATYRQAGQPEAAYRAVNVEGTRHLLDAARAAGVRRVVHCSTGGVHGHIEHPPANEDAPIAPGDIYQQTKLEGERLARACGEAGSVEVVIVRPTGIYGPGDTRLLKLFRGIARGTFPMIGDGQVFYHLNYVDDLAEGVRLCGEVPAAAGRTYLLGGAEYTTLAELVALVADVLGVAPPRWRVPVWPVWLAAASCEFLCVPFGIEPPLYRRRIAFYTKSRAFDISRARRELGYAPRVDLRTGIGRTAAWYREQGLLG